MTNDERRTTNDELKQQRRQRHDYKQKQTRKSRLVHFYAGKFNMQNLTRRTFAKLSVAAAATAAAPVFIPSSSGASEDDKLQSEFLLDLALDAQPPHRVGSAGSDRLIVAVSGGTFEGPRLKGKIITPGGDWIVQRADGSRLTCAFCYRRMTSR
jgi:hypothetical protein